MSARGWAALGAFMVAVVVVGWYLTALVWFECRADHSWLYCFRLVSR